MRFSWNCWPIVVHVMRILIAAFIQRMIGITKLDVTYVSPSHSVITFSTSFKTDTVSRNKSSWFRVSISTVSLYFNVIGYTYSWSSRNRSIMIRVEFHLLGTSYSDLRIVASVFSSRFCNRGNSSETRTLGSPLFLYKPILHTLGSTQFIQHTIVPPSAYYSTSVVLHEAAMYDTSNQSNTRRFCTCFDTARDDSAQPRIHHKPIPHVPDSTQPVSTHQFFSTKLVLHHRSPFLLTNISQVGKVGRRYGWLPLSRQHF